MPNSFFSKIWLFIAGFTLFQGLFILEAVPGDPKEAGSPFIQNYDADDYNTNSQSWEILQDSRGVMYFGNNEGILEFDGVAWRVIKVKNGTMCRALAIDKNHRIYVGAVGELGYLAPDKHGRLGYVSLNHLIDANHKPFPDVWNISVEEEGIYFLTIDKIFLLRNGKIETIHFSNMRNLYKVHGKLLAVHPQDGIMQLKNGKLTPLPGCTQFNRKNYKKVVPIAFKDGKMLIYTDSKGLFLHHNGTIVKFNTEVDQYIIGDRYLRGRQLDDHRYLFLINNSGIIMIDHNGKFLQLINEQSGLRSNNVNDVYIDKANNMWATSHMGISYIHTGSPLTKFSSRTGLKGSILSVRRHQGKIYVGGFYGLYSLSTDVERRMKERTLFDNCGTKEQCFAIFSAPDMLLSAGEGIIRINKNKVEKVTESRTVMSFIQHPYRQNIILFGKYPGFGAIKINQRGNTENKQFTLLPDDVFAPLKNDAVYHIISVPNGDVWLQLRNSDLARLQFLHTGADQGTGNGLRDLKITRYTPGNGLPENTYGRLQLLNGEVTVGTTSHVYVWNGNEFNVMAEFGKIGIDPAFNYDKQLFARNQRLYFKAGNRIGIFGYMQAPGEAKELKWNPLPFVKMRAANRVFTEPDGTAWIGAEDGLYRYDPEIKKNYAQDYDLLIRKVITNNDREIFGGFFYQLIDVPNGNKSTLQKRGLKAQPAHQIPELEYSDNNLTFYFTALFFENEKSTQFSYKLVGFDEKWSTWNKDSKAVYTNLPEGDYQFRIRARNIFQHYGNETGYSFTILPPWYRGILAYVVYALTLAFLIYMGGKLYTRRLKAQKMRLEELVGERTEEIKLQNIEIRKQAEELSRQKEELKQKQEAADAANRSKSLFLARMSHEIRTPINGVIGFAEMMLDTPLNDEQGEFIRTIVRSGETLLGLINEILDLSKIEAGKLTFEKRDFDLEVMAFDICHLILPRLDGRQIEMMCRISDEVPAFVKSDPGRVRQVLMNLIGNAAKFTRQGEIELSISIVDEMETQLKFEAAVRDTGIGIPKDKQELVFKQFQQADESTTRQFGGTGLGLSICKQIARLLDGDIQLESEEGKGSVFRFTAWVDKSTKKVTAIKPSLHLEGKRVLVADDNPNNLEILMHLTEKIGMRATALQRSKEILPAILESIRHNDPYDICILDIQMPSLSGFEVAALVRGHENKKVAGLPLLALSCSTDRQIRMFSDHGFNAFLPKPIQGEKLIIMMKRLLKLDMEEGERKEADRQLLTRFSLAEEAKHSVYILMAEDNPINRKLATAMLTKAGYKLQTAENGREAIEMFEAEPQKFSMILMDLHMPEMDGLEAVRVIRGKGYKDIPIIAVTADAMKEDRNRCIEAGMNDYISKPIKRETIFKMVRKWTHHYKF